MIEINPTFFQLLEIPVWLLNQKEQVLLQSQAAIQLEKVYPLRIPAILEISRGEGCARHSTKEACLDCPLEGSVSPYGFPFLLLDQKGQEVEFWGQVNQSGEQILLQVTPKKTENRSDSMFDYLNDAREAERKKIAQDLHDGIAQSIYSLMLETRGIKWLDGADRQLKLKEIDRHFSEVLQEVKNLAGELRPMSLDELGLVQALEQFIERTNEMTGFEIEMTVLGERKILSETVRTAVYRIVQEAVANAMKYSQSNTVYLTLDYQQSLVVTIQDEGAGFEPTETVQGFGLQNMRERAHAICGEVTIVSSPNNGTTIRVQIPLKEGFL